MIPSTDGDGGPRSLRPIAVFIPALHDLGGTERATLECVRRWARDRDVVVYTRFAQAELPPNVSVVTIRLPTRPHLMGWALFYLRATAIARRLRAMPAPTRPIIFSPGVNLVLADITVAHIYFRQFRDVMRADVEAGLALPARFWHPGRLAPDWRRVHSAIFAGVLRAVERRFYRRTAFVFAVSDLEAIAMRSDGIRVAGIAPNGVDAEAFSPAPKSTADKFRVLTIGSETEKKGLDVLLVAVAASGLRDTTSVTIVTRAENEAWLLGFARSCAYENFTLVTQPSLGPDNFRDTDVYVAASREDSFNMPALEAMACGIPVVLSARCGLADWAGAAALIVQPTPSDVESAIRQLQDDPAERERLVIAGLSLARLMTWDSTAASMAHALEWLDSNP